jgi:hypothetical protein
MTTLSSLTSALERCWTAIRTVHPDVRDAAIVVYLHPRGDRRGHFVDGAWTTSDHNQLDEVHVSSHILDEGAQSVFRTLLHEACHSIARTRSIDECSRQGRYHNWRFAALAHNIGLVTASDTVCGCVTPAITDAAQVQYANAIEELHNAIGLWRGLQQPGQVTRKPKKRTSSGNKLVCPRCRRVIRASNKTLQGGAIRCVPCGKDFVLDTVPPSRKMRH